MNIFSAAVAAIIIAMLAVVLKQYNKSWGLLIGILGGLFLLLAATGLLADLISFFNQMAATAGIDESQTEILFRALGVAYIIQLAGDVCRDAGERVLASKIELFGKAALLVTALPLFTEVLNMIQRMLAQN